jgi:hypothetical protein
VPFPRRAVPLALLAALAACRAPDPRFARLTAGIGGDSALKVMDEAKPVRADPFLVKGQYIQAMYFRGPGDGDTAGRKLSPLVMINGKLAGWGWKYLDSVAAATSIPVPGK